eukprot:138226-Amphidinium_carterae.1
MHEVLLVGGDVHQGGWTAIFDNANEYDNDMLQHACCSFKPFDCCTHKCFSLVAGQQFLTEGVSLERQKSTTHTSQERGGFARVILPRLEFVELSAEDIMQQLTTSAISNAVQVDQPWLHHDALLVHKQSPPKTARLAHVAQQSG